jgi:hypothetical protein
MKLKVVKREFKEVETHLDLPVYLYFQDELGYDELVKITETNKITIKYDYTGFTILVDNDFQVEDYNWERCLTTEKHFNECYSEVLEYLTNAINK